MRLWSMSPSFFLPWLEFALGYRVGDETIAAPGLLVLQIRMFPIGEEAWLPGFARMGGLCLDGPS
jgi:hypothetical protein